MKLNNSAEIDVPAENVWTFLQDEHAVAACLPGASLTEAVGEDTYNGTLRLAIGPLSMNYNGQVEVTSRDPDQRVIAMNASGRDRRGSGSVRADVRVGVDPIDSGHSRLHLVSDVALTGRLASLGRGVQDVSNKMFTEFTQQVVNQIQGGQSGQAPVPAPAPKTVPSGRTGDQAPALPRADAPTDGGQASIRLLPLFWSVSRERLANFLERLGARVRP